MAYFNGTTWVSQAPTTTKSTGSSKSSGSNIVSQQMNQIKNQNVTKANQAVANSASKKTNNSSLTSSGQKAEQLSRNTSSGTSQAAQRMADSVQQSINAKKATQNPVNPVVTPVTPVVEEVETPSYNYESIINSAYDAQKSAADAYMDNIRKYANQAYDENKRNSYAGLRAIERALGKRSSPFGGTEQWTLGKAYNSYNNALSGFDKTRQQALDTGNVNYLSQLATAEGNKTDRLLKLLMQ